MTGIKHDSDKLPMDLLPPHALEGVVRVLAHGAKRYGEWNWLAVPDARKRYTRALLRHMLEVMKGKNIDPDSGEPHLAHVCCNAMFLLELFFHAEEAKRPR